MSEPFWERTYADIEGPDTFGSPSNEIVRLARVLGRGATVLDIGSGDGRNAVFLAEQGLAVTAIDVSEVGIAKLAHRAGIAGVSINAVVADVCSYEISGQYDLIIAHGMLHLLRPECRDEVLSSMIANTKHGGFNVVAVFTDSIPSPDDLAPFTIGLFKEGEIFDRYRDWIIDEQRSYVLEDEHPGGIRHRHPINKVVAQKPNA
ncbi:MAG: methyltransferase domain-containing protein [bacterium]|nr:methyltransferase domain-containing protein [Candidatus Kapabacteria bacterium]